MSSSSWLSLLLVLYTISLYLIDGKCDILGVHPDDCHKYKNAKPNNFFYCGGDSNKKLPLKYVNDDYCDCVGSGDDEPGTSACSHGKFWCRNIGFRGRFIYSSWVNDGICDCCDGSDETHNDKVTCDNTCSEKAKEELQDMIEDKKKYMEAIKIKQSLLRIASSKMNEKKYKKEQIEKELEEKQIELKQKEEIKRNAEEKENAYKEEKQRKKDEERAQKEEQRRKECEEKGEGNCDQIETETEQTEEEEEETETHEQMDSDHEETAAERHRRKRKERRDRRNARNEERRERRKIRREAQLQQEKEEVQQVETDQEDQRHDHTPDEEFPYPEQYRPHEEDQIHIETESQPHLHTPDEEFPYPEQYRPHEEEEEEGEGDGFDWSEFDEDEDEEEENYLRYMAEMNEEEEVKEEEEEVDEVLDELSENASDARREYNDVNRRIRDLEKELEDMNQALNSDFGEKNIFASLLDECYSTKIEKYDYEFCPFVSAKQKEGGSSTDLGSFKQFGVTEKKETVMSFEGGQKCWNGPKRSANVVFKCDTESEVVAVSEPATCKYSMIFHTPLACRQEELDRLTHSIQNQFKTEL